MEISGHVSLWQANQSELLAFSLLSSGKDNLHFPLVARVQLSKSCLDGIVPATNRKQMLMISGRVRLPSLPAFQRNGLSDHHPGLTASTRLEPTDLLTWCPPRSGRHPNVTSCRSVCIHDVSVPARGHLEGSGGQLLPGYPAPAALTSRGSGAIRFTKHRSRGKAVL